MCIRDRRKTARDDAMKAGALIVLEEVPLLFESKLEGDYDVTIVVDARTEVRSARAFVTRNWSAEEFRSIESSQMPSEEKRKRADYVIENNGDFDLLERSAQFVWNVVASRSDCDE